MTDNYTFKNVDHSAEQSSKADSGREEVVFELLVTVRKIKRLTATIGASALVMAAADICIRLFFKIKGF